MARIIVLVIAGLSLASCANDGGVLGELMPHWVGGLPKDAPPRPGTPEYEAFRQQSEAEAARDKSKDRSKSAAAEKKDLVQ